MKTSVKNTSKKATVKAIRVSPAEVLKSKPKKAKAPKVSAYKTKVIGGNRELKVAQKSLGGCIRTLINFRKEAGLSQAAVNYLRSTQKDQKVYATALKRVRKSKNGNYSPFYVLQDLYKQGLIK